jgi:hypothetical protein
MSIKLTAPVMIGGLVQPVGAELSLAADQEAEYVNRGVAVYGSLPSFPGAVVPLAFSAEAGVALDGSSSYAFLTSKKRVDLRQYGAVPNLQTVEAAAANHIAMTKALAALNDVGGTIVFSEPYFFTTGYTSRRMIVLEGLNDAAPVTFIPTASGNLFFTWTGVGAPVSLLNEEGQLPACGVSRMTFKSDRSIPAGCIKFIKCDRALIHFSAAIGFKGRSLELQRTREIVGGGWSSRYCGLFDISNPAECREDVLIASVDGTGDTSNLNIIDKFSLVFPFWHCMVIDGAPNNTLLSYLFHHMGRGNTAIESNFCAMFGGTPGFTGTTPNNEYAGLHERVANAPNVSGLKWSRSFAEARTLLVKGSSEETRIGSGRIIGGLTTATVEVTGGSSVALNDCSIENGGAFVASFAAVAATDLLTVGAVQGGSTCDVLPATGTPLRFTTTTTLPAPLEPGLDYYLIRVSDGTFKVADSFALAIAGTPIDITDAGTGTHVAYVGGHPLLVTDNSIATVTEKTFINNGRVAAFRDETSTIYGLARTGTTFVQGARHPTAGGEIKLFELRRARMDSTADQAFRKVFPGGVRYKISRIVAVNRNAKSAAAAVGGIYTAAAKGGSQVVANSQTFTPMTAENSVRSLTLATYANDNNMADGTFGGSNLFLSLTTPAAAAAVADFYIYGTVMD